MLFLLQDGNTNGAIYALLGLALVLVFAVTRVILIPQGEFVTCGALSYAMLATGQVLGRGMAPRACCGPALSNAAVTAESAPLHRPEHRGLWAHRRLHRRTVAVLRLFADRQGAARHRRQPA